MRSEVDYILSDFFRLKQFFRLQPPIITSSDCEGAGEVFGVTGTTAQSAVAESAAHNDDRDQFFHTQKYLTVSSQLHLEAFIHEHPKAWTLSPTFRAERSDTPRHVSEFWMLEAELRTQTLDDVLNIVEEMLRTLVDGLLKTTILDEILHVKQKARRRKDENEMPNLRFRWDSLRRPFWPRIKYDDAIGLLQNAASVGGASFLHDPSMNGLHLEHERWLAATIGKDGPVFVTHYPQSIKPFYMLPTPTTQGSHEYPTMECFDLLIPEYCEIVGGSLREHRLDALLQAMHRREINGPIPGSPGNLDWYIDLRRYGSVPHGGFGLGLDRLLGFLAGVENVKDVVSWPRYYGRCDG